MRMISVIGVCETTDDGRMVTTRFSFPESIGLHDDPPALRGVVEERLRRDMARYGVDIVPATLSIVLDKVGY